MIEVVQYEERHKRPWNDFVNQAKNGVFLFNRDYMEYHADRFTDNSLLFFAEEKLIGLLPANLTKDGLISHGGLTFGGIVTNTRMRAGTMLEIFEALHQYVRAASIGRLLYKTVPYIYHDVPAEEDLYALFRQNARLVRRDLSTTVRQSARPALTKGRKWSLKQGRSHEIAVRQSEDYDTFMAIETEVLQKKYGKLPVHSAAEIALLAGRFPENIKLFGSFKDDTMLAGVIIYESRNVAHAQYIATTDQGKQLAALDLILDFLINEYYVAKRYFDFGVSTEADGRYLNAGLAEHKESFGGRAVVYDTYELTV
ncbi:MAG: hypothetical protein QOJ88_334 [Pyrinomonadaceae bacterium]|jgi:hypothetical protein|nr:hypothetical protein [Pyrinomonadaceae bacterium]